MRYTKNGKNRYIFIILDKNENIIKYINDGISNKNVIDKMHDLGISDCNRHYTGNSYDASLMRCWAKDRKNTLNNKGYTLFNADGYLASRFNDEIKVKYVVIDMAQKDKHTTDINKILTLL